MNKTSIAGVMLATAVALAFTGSVVSAEDAPGASTAAQIKCVGGNACKGSERLQDCDFRERLQRKKFVQGQRLRDHRRRQIVRSPGWSRRQESPDARYVVGRVAVPAIYAHAFNIISASPG